MLQMGPGVNASIVPPIARAVRGGDAARLGAVLTELQQMGAFSEDLFAAARPDRYARRLVHRDPDGAFVIVAMTWAEGQGACLHDHEGFWGAEVVVRGRMSETAFDLLESDGDRRYRFARRSRRENEPGAVGLILPPQEYHDFGNAAAAVSHTLHVYSGELTAPRIFAAGAAGWWNARRVEVHYDA